MDLAKTVTYIFEDDEWVSKVLITAAVTFGAALLSPILIGLVFVAALQGWTIQLIRNMLNGVEHPMPKWEDFGAKMQLGMQPLIAGVVYSIIPLILGCIVFSPVALIGATGNEDATGLFAGGAACLVIPVLLVYGIIAGLFYSVGTIKYAKDEKIGVYFAFGDLWNTLSANSNLTGQYVLFYIIIQVVVGALGSTGIGGILGLVTPPVMAHLLGQYALGLEGKAKRGVA